MINIKSKITPQILEWYWLGAEKFLRKRISATLKKEKLKTSFLQKTLPDYLQHIVLGNPYELEKFRVKFLREINTNEVALKWIFDYNRFVSYQKDPWNAYTLAEKLNVSTCPYCNVQYTHTVINSKEGVNITRPQFDHFLDKGVNPIFALSIYNLVPSCPRCNHTKGTKNYSIESHVHPYVEGFDNRMKFNVEVSKYSFFYGDVAGAEISFKPTPLCSNKFEARAQRNIVDFKLKDIYQQHRDIVNELLQKSLIYDAKYRKELYEKYQDILFKNDDQLSNFVTGNFVTDKELIFRPLSKLTKDVIEQFELWK